MNVTLPLAVRATREQELDHYIDADLSPEDEALALAIAETWSDEAIAFAYQQLRFE